MIRTKSLLISPLFLFVASVITFDQANAVPKPNIMFLFADDQWEDTVAAFGNPHIETPYIDRSVREGFSFRENYCFGSSGGAVCVPSRVMLMSCKTLFNVRSDMSNAKVLFPELLQQKRLRHVRHRKMAQWQALVAALFSEWLGRCQKRST